MNHTFSSILLRWYEFNKRDLPWRNETDPYKIWISEIILQQTRVAQGWDYYMRFIQRFPTVQSIYEGGEQEVLKYWQGLGYYTRARNIYAGAVYIMEKHQGKFPQIYNEILQIKGVGEYTAAAIASLAFRLPHAVVDGNVLRVCARYFGIFDPIDASAGKKKISQLVNQLIDSKPPDIFNQAMMDFGATQCTPQNPDCEKCCFSTTCFANLHFEQANLPVKSHKTKTRNRYFYYLHIQYNNSIYLQKREANDIWKGLYEFPLLETDTILSEENLINHAFLNKLFEKTNWHIADVSLPYKHVLSHQIITATFVSVIIENKLQSTDYLCISKKELSNYPISRLMEKFVNTLGKGDY